MFVAVIFLLIAVLGGVNYYLAHRLWKWIHYFVPKFSIIIPLVLFMVLTVLMILSFIKRFEGKLQWYISVIGNLWMGILVYLLLFFLLSDLIMQILRVLPISQITKIQAVAGICATVLALSISAYGVLNARRIFTTQYDIKLSDTPTSELTVALISDVHLGAVGSESRLEKIVAEINRLEPDLVCIAGDFFDTNYDSILNAEKAIETVRQIKSTYGIYACLGNHDAGKTLSHMEDFLRQADVHLLKDDYAIIDGKMILVGRLDSSPIGGAGELQRGEMTDILKGADGDLPVVVLDHNPINVDHYRNEADLILSGHTHKGQIFPGSLITGAMYAVDYGYYRSDSGVQAVVTSGAGTWGLPMRVGTKCEVVRIDLEF